MATTQRRDVFIWPSWITGLLASDDNCRFAPWFKAHFKFDKVERGDGSLAQWSADHGAMVQQRQIALIADGWTVSLEDQNKFFLEGKVATLSGKPDIVATRGEDALVVDCKSGQRKHKDWWQVALYMWVLPLVNDAVKGKRLVGEIRYKDGVVLIQPEEVTQETRARLSEQIRESGGPTAPKRVPSYRECMFCDIGKADCPQRIEKRTETTVAHGLF